MSRPELTHSLSAADFLDFYWLKQELVVFCRGNNISTSGNKQELTRRVAHFLRTGTHLPQAKRTRRCVQMPTCFTRETIIDEGWRCSQGLRQFFEQEIGSHFHFNQFLRDFIVRNGIGHTLDEAIVGWQHSKQMPKGESKIGGQFEYNRFVRAFYLENPAAKQAEAMVAWRAFRGTRQSLR